MSQTAATTDIGSAPVCIYCGHTDQMQFKEFRNVGSDPHVSHAFEGPERRYQVWDCRRCRGETRVEV